MTQTGPQETGLPWIIVGYGRVGQSLALLAQQLDQPLKATWNRTQQAADKAQVNSPNPRFGPLPQALLSDLGDTPHLVWITVVDDAIADTYDALASHLPDRSLVVHTSGSLSSQIFSDHDHLHTASLHPLQAIADPQVALTRFPRSFWSIEGDALATDYLRRLLTPAGISPTSIEASAKTLYHASAVTAANLLVSLMDGAMTMAQSAGISPQQARTMLVELAKSSLENLADKPPAQAVTGPAARGDLATIESHRQALADQGDPSLLKIYDLLTQRVLDGLADEPQETSE